LPTAPEPGPDLHAVAHRIERLLEELQSSADARVWSQVEELVRALTDLYGAGLTRTVELAEQRVAHGSGDLRRLLAGDELVSSLLVLHDAHPDGLAARAERAAAAAEVSIGAALRVTGVESGSGTVRVSVRDGGPSGGFDGSGLVDAVRQALWDALPDAGSIEVEVEVDLGPVGTPVRLSRKRAAAGAGP
jgi:hypothetical protein